MAHIAVSGIGSGADLGIAGMLTAQCGLPLHTHIHAVDQLNTIATAGINTAFDEVPLQQMFGRYSQLTQKGLIQVLIGVIQRQPQFTQSQHQCGSALQPFDQTTRAAAARLLPYPMVLYRPASAHHLLRQATAGTGHAVDVAALCRN